jgi:hypothetical protein
MLKARIEASAHILELRQTEQGGGTVLRYGIIIPDPLKPAIPGMTQFARAGGVHANLYPGISGRRRRLRLNACRRWRPGVSNTPNTPSRGGVGSQAQTLKGTLG